MKLLVHPRIHRKHPDLDDQDIESAFFSLARYIRRSTGECVGVGVDMQGRFVELVFREIDGAILIYHGLTPPTRKVLEELERRGR